ncbi:MAG TPA: NfeD family protein [Mycobacteriales bacterium]|nr:NfeD family protein [Mycobacteriales bacterium]
MSDIETWRWIWLGAAVLFLVGEIAVAGSFFLAPFAAGAALASAVAFSGASVTTSWVVFVVASAVAAALLRPLAKRLDRSSPESTSGSGRWVGREAVVVETVPPSGVGTGLVRLDQEQWRAESADADDIEVGARVLVARVDGTRLVVRRTIPADKESA